jgi:hypothetical protein
MHSQRSRIWIPACAGMTVLGRYDKAEPLHGALT